MRGLLAIGALAMAVASSACGSADIGDRPSVGDPDAHVDDPDPDAAVGDDDDDDLADARVDPPVDAASPLVDATPCLGGDAQTTDPDTGTCYIYVAARLTWNNARDACEALGGILASSTSLDEDLLLAGLVTDPDNQPDAWLGATDAVSETDYFWITGEPMDFLNWRSGEPNDGGPNGNEDCMVLESDTEGTWDDRPCNFTLGYFCEL